MMFGARFLRHLHLLLALVACLALIGAPLVGASTARGVIVEETEEGTERTPSGAAGAFAPSPAAGRRFERSPQADRSVDDLHRASRHVPCVASAHPPRRNPSWMRPIRC